MRAFFAAMSTKALCIPRRAWSDSAQSDRRSVCLAAVLSTERAPCTSSMRRYASPRRLMWPRRDLPPEEFWRGTRCEPGGELSAARKVARVSYGGHDRHGRERADAANLHQALGRFALPSLLFELPVVGADAFIELDQVSTQVLD